MDSKRLSELGLVHPDDPAYVKPEVKLNTWESMLKGLEKSGGDPKFINRFIRKYDLKGVDNSGTQGKNANITGPLP